MTGVADRHLRVARPLGRVDLEAAERAARALLGALGADPADEGLADTPRRVAAAYAELLTPLPFNPTFPNDEGYDELPAGSRSGWARAGSGRSSRPSTCA